MNDDQASVNPPFLMNQNIRDTFSKWPKSLLPNNKPPTTQDNAMIAQTSREVVHLPHQKVSTISSHLKDKTRMNSSTFYGSKVEADPQDFIDKIYKILYTMRLSTSQKIELATYQPNDVALSWYFQWRNNRSLRCRLGTWEVFKKTFLDWFFQREKVGS